MKYLETLGIISCLAFVSSSALAADNYNDPTAPAGSTYDTVVYWGFDYAGSSVRDAYGADVGFVTAINGDIGASGWTLTGNLGLGRTDGAVSETDSFYGSALLGYQWHFPGYYVSVSAGLHYVENDETPGGGITDDGKFGALVQYGFETKTPNSLYLQSYGAASTVFDQRYFHAKAGYKTDRLRFGGEFTAFDEVASEAVFRYGAFVGDIPLGDTLTMVVSAGYEDQSDPTEKDGFYATLGFVVPLDLR